MSLSVAQTHTWIGETIAAGHKVKTVKNNELTMMTGSCWEDVYVDGQFYCNIVDGELALGTAVRELKHAA